MSFFKKSGLLLVVASLIFSVAAWADGGETSGGGGGDKVETLFFRAKSDAALLLSRVIYEDVPSLQLSQGPKAWLIAGGPERLARLKNMAKLVTLSFIPEPCYQDGQPRNACFDASDPKHPTMIISRSMNQNTTPSQAVALVIHECGHLIGEPNHVLLSQLGTELQTAFHTEILALLNDAISASIEDRTKISFTVESTPRADGSIVVRATPMEADHDLPTVVVVLKDVTPLNLDDKVEAFLQIAQTESQKVLNHDGMSEGENQVITTLELMRHGTPDGTFNTSPGNAVTAGSELTLGHNGQWNSAVWVQLPGAIRHLSMRGDSGSQSVQWLRTLIQVQHGDSQATPESTVAKVSASIYSQQNGNALSGDRFLQDGLLQIGTVEVSSTPNRTRGDLELVGAQISNGGTTKYIGAALAGSFGLGMRFWDQGSARYDVVAHGSMTMCIFVRQLSLYFGGEFEGMVVPFSDSDNAPEEGQQRYWSELAWVLPTKKPLRAAIGWSKREALKGRTPDPYDLTPMGNSGYLRFSGRF